MTGLGDLRDEKLLVNSKQIGKNQRGGHGLSPFLWSFSWSCCCVGEFICNTPNLKSFCTPPPELMMILISIITINDDTDVGDYYDWKDDPEWSMVIYRDCVFYFQSFFLWFDGRFLQSVTIVIKALLLKVSPSVTLNNSIVSNNLILWEPQECGHGNSLRLNAFLRNLNALSEEKVYIIWWKLSNND